MKRCDKNEGRNDRGPKDTLGIFSDSAIKGVKSTRMRCLSSLIRSSVGLVLAEKSLFFFFSRVFSASTFPTPNPSYVDFYLIFKVQMLEFSSSLLFSLLYHKNFFKSTIPLILPDFRRFSSKYSKKQHKIANFRRKSSLFGAFSALFDQKAGFLCKISRFSAYFFQKFSKIFGNFALHPLVLIEKFQFIRFR